MCWVSLTLIGFAFGAGRVNISDGKGDGATKSEKKRGYNRVLSSGPVAERRPLNFTGSRREVDFEWANDPALKNVFVSDFVWSINVFRTRKRYFEMIELLRQRNPRAIIGRYNSATCAKLSSRDSIIPVAYPLEKCSENWLLHTETGRRVPYMKRIKGTKKYREDGRYFLDMRKPEVRTAVIREMVARALNDGLDATCYDNCYWDVVPRYLPVSVEEWNKAMLVFYKEAGYEAKKNGLLCVVNVAIPAFKIPGGVRAIIPHVDGLMLETSFHPLVIERGKLQEELDAYKWALEQSKMIFLIPRRQTLEAESFALKKVRPLDNIRQGRIFVTIGRNLDRGEERFIHDNPLYR